MQDIGSTLRNHGSIDGSCPLLQDPILFFFCAKNGLCFMLRMGQISRLWRRKGKYFPSPIRKPLDCHWVSLKGVCWLLLEEKASSTSYLHCVSPKTTSIRLSAFPHFHPILSSLLTYLQCISRHPFPPGSLQQHSRRS